MIDYINNLLRSYQSVEGERPLAKLIERRIEMNDDPYTDIDTQIIDLIMFDKTVFGYPENLRMWEEWLGPDATFDEINRMAEWLEDRGLAVYSPTGRAGWAIARRGDVERLFDTDYAASLASVASTDLGR